MTDTLDSLKQLDQALRTLDTAASMAPVSRADHVRIQEAARLLSDDLNQRAATLRVAQESKPAEAAG